MHTLPGLLSTSEQSSASWAIASVRGFATSARERATRGRNVVVTTSMTSLSKLLGIPVEGTEVPRVERDVGLRRTHGAKA